MLAAANDRASAQTLSAKLPVLVLALLSWGAAPLELQAAPPVVFAAQPVSPRVLGDAERETARKAYAATQSALGRGKVALAAEHARSVFDVLPTLQTAAFLADLLANDRQDCEAAAVARAAEGLPAEEESAAEREAQASLQALRRRMSRRCSQPPAALEARYLAKVYELTADPTLAGRLAAATTAAGRPCDALALALSARASGRAAEPPSSLAAALAGAARSCGAGYGWGRVLVSPPSGQVAVEGTAVQPGVLLAVPGGEVAVEARWPDALPVRRRWSVPVGGAADSLQITQQPGRTANPGARASQLAKGATGSAAGSVWGWSLLGGGLALAAGGAGAYVWGLGAGDDANALAASAQYEDERTTWEGHRDDARLGEALGWSLMGVGAAAAITGGVLLIIDPSGATTEGTASGLGPALCSHHAGLSWRGRF